MEIEHIIYGTTPHVGNFNMPLNCAINDITTLFSYF